MKYGFYKRFFQVDALILLGTIPFLTEYIIYTHLAPSASPLLARLIIAATFIAFLANSRLFGFLQSIFPALKRYVIRSVLVGYLLANFASSDVSFDGDIQSDLQSYFLIGNLAIGVLLIGFAKIAAMLGK